MNPLSLYQITEGRCEYAEALAAPLSDLSPAAFAQLPRLKPSYEGQLFRVRYEVRGPGPEPLRVWVDEQGQAALSLTPDGYARLGLSRNPFVLERYTAHREAWTGVAQAHWLERGHEAPQPGTRTLVQLLGVKGAGKSSHLARWRGVQPGPSAYFPPEYLGRWRWPPLAPICYWDEACRIPAPLLWLALGRAAQQGHTVCVGTHRDLGPVARAAGLAVRTVAFGSLTAAEVLAWAERHIAAAQLPGKCSPLHLTEQQAEAVAQAAASSWREVGAALHIWAAREAERAVDTVW